VFFALIVGGGASLLNIAVHAFATVAMVRAVRAKFYGEFHSSPMLRLIIIMVTAVSVLMIAHLFEIWVWSLFYEFLGVTPAGADDFTFAFVNYTTLGYGDVVPVPRWKVLGPMTAMNGVLLFGWSTAVLFQILSASSHRLEMKF
jgi:Ion channel